MTDNDPDLPFIDTESGGKPSLTQRAKGLLPWLETPFECECGAYCRSTTEYVDSQAARMPVWSCTECERRYHREESSGSLGADMW